MSDTRDTPAVDDPPSVAPTLPPAEPVSRTATFPGLAPADAATLPPAPPAGSPPAPAPVTVPGYEVLGELGRGGMGVVYRARQVGLNRPVALKMVLAGGHASAGELARFRTEAEAIAQLQHPNVVQVYEVGEQNGLPYFSLEFCPGGSLDRQLDGTPWEPAKAAALVETLARAIHAAHQAGVVHRDLKPANVLLAADGTPKITDFGLAKKLDAGDGPTKSGAIMGTPSYMAPEQAAGEAKVVGPAADVYALGAILYELLTGRPPFKAATALDTILQVISDEPVPPTQLQGKTPRDLETICLTCLQKEPSKRYSSAAALAEDLRRFRTGEPIWARPVGAVERAMKWVRRRPVTASLVGVTAAGALLLMGIIVAFLAVVYGKNKDLELSAGQARKAAADAQVQLERARANLMTAQLQRVAGIYEHQPLLALDLLHDLEACPLDRQDPAWHFYERACQRWERAILRGHRSPIHSVALSADGRILASGGADGMVKLWDVATGQERATLLRHPRDVSSVAFSGDGRVLATGDSDGTVRLWDMATGQERASLRGHKLGVNSVAFSGDGKILASGGGAYDVQHRPLFELKLWDVATTQERANLRGHKGPVHSVALSGDGKILASGGGANDAQGRPLFGELKIWDVATTQERASLRGHKGPVHSVALSGDGKILASGGGGGWDGEYKSSSEELKLWEVATAQERASLQGHQLWVNSVAFSGNGKTLASADALGTVKIWDAATGQERASLGSKDRHWVKTVALSGDGKTLATGGSYDAQGNGLPGELKLWNLAPNQERSTLKRHTGGVGALAFSSDGETLASGSADKSMRLWNVATGKNRRLLLGHTDEVLSIALSLDGKTLASGSQDKTVKLWDTVAGQERGTIRGLKGTVYTVLFTSNGAKLASGDGEGEIELWDMTMAQERPRTFRGHTGTVSALAFSSNGKTLGSASDDRGVKIWDLVTGEERKRLDNAETVSSLVFSGDGQVLAGSSRKTVKLWDAATGQLRISFTGHSRAISSIAFSSDGRTLATGGHDGAVKLWDVATGHERASLMAHAGGVWSVTFSADGKTLASGGRDGTVKLWDVGPAEERRSPRIP
jgi:WD40 repeat protein